MRALPFSGVWIWWLLVAPASAAPLSSAERDRICEAHIRESQKSVCQQLIVLDENTPTAVRRQQQSCVFSSSEPAKCLNAAQRETLDKMVAQRRIDCRAFSDEELRCLNHPSQACQPILDSMTLWREPIPSAPPGPPIAARFELPPISEVDRDERKFVLTSDGTLSIVDPHAKSAFRKGKRVSGGRGTGYRFELPDIKVNSDRYPIAAPGAVVYNDDEAFIRTTNLIRRDGSRWKVKTGCVGRPAADERFVYTVSFGLDERGPVSLLALDQRDGRVVWQRELAPTAPELKWRDDVRVVAAPGHLVAVVILQAWALETR